MNQLDFKGRIAIVTGGARGIGLAIVKRLLRSGARVRIWDRDGKLLAGIVKELGANATGDALDLLRLADGRAAVLLDDDRHAQNATGGARTG